ncbi:MAG: hypothetical protein V7734_15835 [Maribacter arcticus]|uniref:hypothetical protein n=1 Tax=Maribacter arcticus TaxID=561365 RepID=UPI003002A8F5
MRNRIVIAFSILLCILWSTSCRKDFEYAPSNGNLSFSKDTVYLDTVFSSIGSSTYTLKVFNDTKDDIIIPNISLKNGPESFYRLNVDGVAGKEFSNIPIYAKDSLFILIETTISIIDGSIKELLYTDAIQFDKEPFQQSVELVTLAKDAIFLYPKGNPEIETEIINLYTDEAGNPINISGFELKDEELYFTNSKPFVIYGYVIIPDEKELIIEAGARIHFHKNSGIYVKDGAKLIVNGTLSKDSVALEGEVIFEGDRLEPEFAETPGQWGGLWISNGSSNNSINHLTIKNAEIGLFVGGLSNDTETTFILTNSQIYNNTRYNLWTKNAKLEAKNLVLGNAGSSSLLIENGGNYTFIHSTIANYWNKGFRYNTALEIKNDSQEIGFDLVKADFKNCIIDGNRQNEISLITDNQNSFNFNFLNCFIKYTQNETSSPLNYLYDFTNSELYSDIILNGEVDYFLTTKNDFRIGLDSDVIDKGDLDTANYSPLDILGTQRIPAPDLGAFQAIEKE